MSSAPLRPFLPLDGMQRKRWPWALVVAAGIAGLSIATEDGELVDCPPGNVARAYLTALGRTHVIFTPQARALMVATDARYWTVRHRRQRTIDLTLDNGPRVRTCPADALPADPIDKAAAWARYFRWMADELDVWPTARCSWGGLGRHLFLATLDDELRIESPEPVGRRGLYGGRKQAPWPGSFTNGVHYDLTAAYLHALGAGPIPRKLRAVRGGVDQLLAHGDADGVAFAYVDVPPELGAWGPLPARRDKRSARFLTWPTGAVHGWWTLGELRVALDHGATVKVRSCYAGQGEGDYFAGWYDAMTKGRRLRSGAAKLAKAHANLLWSSFAVAPVPITHKRYRDEWARMPEIVKRVEAVDFTAGTAYLASIVAARVRRRVFVDVLMPAARANRAIVHVDTDGVIAGKRTGPLLAAGPGQWRADRRMPRVQVRAANVYRYACGDCSWSHREWHYVVAGVGNPDTAERMFRRAGRDQNVVDLDSC